MNIELLSVIVPIYKKEKTIQKELENLSETLAQTPYRYEIIGVVDGTDLDKSYEKAKKLNLPVVEVPVFDYSRHGGRSTSNLKTIFRLIKEVAKYWLKTRLFS